MGKEILQPPGRPTFGARNFVAETAYVCGSVKFGDDVSIWPGVIIRGDVAPITIGQRVNIQDMTMIHTRNRVPLEIGDDAAFGHRAVVHCRRIGRRTLVGIGAIVLDDAEIGEGCLIAAGAVVTPGTIIPDGKLVMGMPAKIVRDLNDRERTYIDDVIQNYLCLKEVHQRGDYPRWFPTA
ncbi:MAG: Protein YrdA [Phycisphaerae bacterium]|nr:Protein YrdA [Phycisphaerae bacterium]